MKNKASKATRKITALLTGVMLSGQFATAGTAIYARAESEAAVDYSVEQNVSSSWYGGCCAEIVLTNLANTETEGWKITFSTTDKISNLWNGSITETIDLGDSYQYTVEALNYNSVIAAGQRISIGYIGEGNDHDLLDVKADMIYAGGATATEAETEPATGTETEPATETETVVETENEFPPATGTIISGFEMEFGEDNPYFQELMDTMDALLKVPDYTAGHSYRTWDIVCPFVNSDSNTNLSIYVYQYGQSYATEDDMVIGSTYRIVGTYRGEEVDRCLLYCEELESLRGCLRKAKVLQVRMLCETSDELYCDYMYRVDNGILVWKDGLGRLTVVTDSELDLPYMGFGYVHLLVTDIQPLDPFVTGEYDYHRDLSGNVIVVE